MTYVIPTASDHRWVLGLLVERLGAQRLMRGQEFVREDRNMTMQITFAGTMRGQKLYHVSCDGDRFFTGTLEEVKRYILIHNEKVRERQAQHDAYLASVRAAG